MKTKIALLSVLVCGISEAAPNNIYSVKEYIANFKYTPERNLAIRLSISANSESADAISEVEAVLGQKGSFNKNSKSIDINLPAKDIDALYKLHTISHIGYIAPREDYEKLSGENSTHQDNRVKIKVAQRSSLPLWTLSKSGELIFIKNKDDTLTEKVERAIESEYSVEPLDEAPDENSLISYKVVLADEVTASKIKNDPNYAVIDDKEDPSKVNIIRNVGVLIDDKYAEVRSYFIKIKSPSDINDVKKFYNRDTFLEQDKISKDLFASIFSEIFPEKIKELTVMQGSNLAIIGLDRSELMSLIKKGDPRIDSIYEKNSSFSPQMNVSTSNGPGGMNLAQTWASNTGNNAWIAILDTGATLTQPQYDGRDYLQACFNTNNPAERKVSKCRNMDSTGAMRGAVSGRTGGYSNSCGIGQPVVGGGLAVDEGACSHGDSVTSIALGNSAAYPAYKGVSYGSNVFAINVSTLHKENAGDATYSPRMFYVDMVKALNEVANQSLSKKMVVNISQGDGVAYGSSCDHLHQDAVNAIATLKFIYNVPVIVSTGNNGYDSAINAPSCFSNVIKASSTHKDTGSRYFGANIAHPMNYGTQSSSSMWLAPGVDLVFSVNNQLFSGTGTSFAAPHVAGAYALVRSAVDSSVSVDSATQFMEDFFPNGIVGFNGYDYLRLRLGN